MPAEYEAIKKSLRKRYPKASDEDLSARAARIFASIYGTNPQHAAKLESEGKWAAYKKAHGKKEDESDVFNISLPGLEIKEDANGDVFVDVIVSTPDLDLGHDIVSEKAQQQIVDQMLTPFGNKVSLFHKRNGEAPIGIVKEAKLIETKGGTSAWARVLLNKFHPNFESTVKMIEQKFIDAASIEYRALKTVEKKVGNVVARVIDEIQMLGFTFTGRPMNPSAQIGAMFVKSFDVVEEKEPKGDEVMTKKEEPVPTGIEEKESVLAKENAELKSQLAALEAKEAEFKKALEAKETQAKEFAELKEQVKKLEVKEKVLAEQTTKVQDETSKVELEFKEFREKPTWEAAAKLIDKYKI